MYGTDKANLWNASPRRRSTQPAAAGDEPDPAQRNSAGMNYYGLDGSESSSAASGGLTQVPKSYGHSRPTSAGYHASNSGDGAGGGGGGGTGGGGAPEERPYSEKVNQIVQQFFWKATMAIVQSRVPTVPIVSPKTGEKKANRWFNIELDEMEDFREEVRQWRVGDSFDPRPLPLIIETYLDTSDLTPTQALVILDSDEKRWNVTEALENAANRTCLNMGLRRGDRGTTKTQQIVLERWKIELSPPFDLPQKPELPVVYKKSIILFRALFSYLALMPTWKFRRRLAKLKLHSSALKIGCRVQSGDDFARSARRWDGLQIPLYSGGERVTDDFSFGKVESPAGSFNITVSFRKNCDFRVDDSEALLSSHFINLDEHYFRPSSNQRPTSQPSALAVARGAEPGSLPAVNPSLQQRPEYVAAHGSLSSFHQAAPSGASPLSTLRAAAADMNRTPSSGSPAERPPTGLRSIQGSRSSLRSTDIPAISRRGSISFAPFKSPSLSASPAASDQAFPGSSVGRVSMPGAHVYRVRPGVGAAATPSPSSYKSAHSTVTPSSEATVSQTPIPISSSPMPQPMTRIASSFSSRRPRISSGASVTRADDDNSSGQASYTSSMAAPGSGLYGVPGTSSYEEDIQIRDFMSMLADGQKATLKSFVGDGGESSSRIASNPLSKFQKMKDSQSALAESMSSSLLLQPASSSATPSRNLSNMPGVVPHTAFSSSSSPGKPLSPHAPHTPAIPSRLSEGLTAQYDHRDRQRHNRSRSPQAAGPDNRMLSQHEVIGEGAATTSPLDIPQSPRFMGPRRANSMSQPREPAEANDSIDFDPMAPYDNRRQSVSLGSADQPPLSMSRLLDLRNASQSALPGTGAAQAASCPHDDAEEDDGLPFGPVRPPSIEEEAPRYAHRFHRGTVLSSPGSSYRGRFSARGRGDTPPAGSTSSLDKNQPGVSGMSGRPGIVSRRTPSWSRPSGQEDEDLLFDMSDMIGQQQSRRSLDQDKGGDSPSSSGRRRSRGGSGVGDTGRGWLAG